MIDEKFKETLKTVVSKLEGKQLNWAVIGSTNMALQGINVSPNDLDIVTSFEGIEKMEGVFKDYMKNEIQTKEASQEDNSDYYEMKLSINGLEVHVVGAGPEDIYYGRVASGRTTTVRVKDFKVPCMKLEAEKETYIATGRQQKAKIIENFLN